LGDSFLELFWNLWLGFWFFLPPSNWPLPDPNTGEITGTGAVANWFGVNGNPGSHGSHR
jgi:hypothetical protein